MAKLERSRILGVGYCEKFINLKNNKVATLFVVDNGTDLSPNDLLRLEEIFNQEECHKMFEPKFLDRRFTSRDLASFINWSKLNSNYYLFLIKDDQQNIVGGIDLQIKDRQSASIGFWQDCQASGYISGGLSCLLPEIHNAGFINIDSYTEPTNIKAMKVLYRQGFIKKEMVKGKTKGTLVRIIKP